MTENGGLRPVPDDDTLNEWLQEQIDENDKALFTVLEDLTVSIENNKEAGRPSNFPYGRLLNYLRSDVSEPNLVRLLAAALWELARE